MSKLNKNKHLEDWGYAMCQGGRIKCTLKYCVDILHPEVVLRDYSEYCTECPYFIAMYGRR